MGINKRMPLAIDEFEPSERDFHKMILVEPHGNVMLRRLLVGCRHGTRLQDLALMASIISQDRVRRSGHFFAVIHARVDVDRHHVGPMIEVFLLRRCKLMLGALRPAMKKVYPLENKGWRRPILGLSQHRRAAQKEKKSENSSKNHSRHPGYLTSDLRPLASAQLKRFDYRAADNTGHREPVISLISAQRFLGPRPESSIDRAVVISFPGQRALDFAHARAGVVLRLINRRSLRRFIRRITVVVVGSVRVGAIRVESISVGIKRERIVDEPEAVPEMATATAPVVIAAPVPVAMPVPGMTRHDPASVESL